MNSENKYLCTQHFLAGVYSILFARGALGPLWARLLVETHRSRVLPAIRVADTAGEVQVRVGFHLVLMQRPSTLSPISVEYFFSWLSFWEKAYRENTIMWPNNIKIVNFIPRFLGEFCWCALNNRRAGIAAAQWKRNFLQVCKHPPFLV